MRSTRAKIARKIEECNATYTKEKEIGNKKSCEEKIWEKRIRKKN